MTKKEHVNPDGNVVTIWIEIYAIIDSNVDIGRGASIGSYASIGIGARIGSGASIGSGARIGSNASIGSHAIIGIGAMIDANAKRYAVRSDGYVFTVGWRNDEMRIFAGCRDFNRAEALAHWNTNHRLYKETRAILKFLGLYTDEE